MSETTTATATATAKADLGALPEWDLGDLYPSKDSDALAADIEAPERPKRRQSPNFTKAASPTLMATISPRTDRRVTRRWAKPSGGS